MIAKAVKGKGFRGALEYDLTKEQGRVIDKNMAGENPRELAAEFGEIRKLRPNLSKAVLHVSLSAAPGEKLTDEQWCEIGKRYMDGMGLEKNQFVITRHTDTEHEHIHILANRIRFDGSVTSDSQDYKRQETIMRELERDYGCNGLPRATRPSAKRRPRARSRAASAPASPVPASSSSNWPTQRPRIAAASPPTRSDWRPQAWNWCQSSSWRARSCPACRTGWTA